jgi:hypothetical protein
MRTSVAPFSGSSENANQKSERAREKPKESLSMRWAQALVPNALDTPLDGEAALAPEVDAARPNGADLFVAARVELARPHHRQDMWQIRLRVFEDRPYALRRGVHEDLVLALELAVHLDLPRDCT